MKKAMLISMVATILLSYSWTGARDWTEKLLLFLQDSWNGPLEAIVYNQSGGTYALTEIRAINDKGCASDLGTTGSKYDDPSDRSLSRNHAFLVSESTCDGMQIKANRGDIVFITREPPSAMRLTNGQLHILESKACPPLNLPKEGAVLCVARGGAVWITSRRGSRQVVP
jgi:hypothetical protein